MGKSSAPTPPDPKETASAQTATNIGTAIAQAELSNTNQITPNGNLTFDQTGEHLYTDPHTGQVHKVPNYTATTTLSPAQQAIKDQTDAAELNIGTLANQQSAFLKDHLGQPVNLNNEAVESRLFELGRNRLDPLIADRRDTTETQLVNRGIRPGSEAYDRAIGNLGQQENDAYNELLLGGRQQAIGEILTERNQPINEISALLGQSQVANPVQDFQPQTQRPIQTVDYAGLVQDNYRTQSENYRSSQAAKSQALGGLFSLGGSLIGLSDERLKTDIKKVGKTDAGLGLYTYRMKGKGQPMQLGVMAQEVEKRDPDAVINLPSGYKAVNYSKAMQLGAAT